MNLIDWLDRLKKRCEYTSLLVIAQKLSFYVITLLSCFFLCDRILYELRIQNQYIFSRSAILFLLISAFCLIFLLSFLKIRFSRVDLSRLALMVDSKVVMNQEFVTAYELQATGAGKKFLDVLVSKASSKLNQIDQKSLTPEPWTRYLLLSLLALSSSILLVAMPYTEFKRPYCDFYAKRTQGIAPLEVHFEEASCGYIDSFDWDFGDGNTSTEANPTHVYTRPGTYSVSLQISGPGGKDRITKHDYINILEPDDIVVDFEAEPAKGRKPLVVSFKNLSENADSYKWDFGDQDGTTTQHPVHVYKDAGVYDVVLQASNSISSKACQKKSYIKVVEPNAPLADFVANPVEGRAPLMVVFEDRSTGEITNCVWDTGDFYSKDRVKSGKFPVHTYHIPGRYSVRLTVKGPGGSDTLLKEHYIHVRDQRSASPELQSRSSSKGTFGPEDQPKRPKVEFIPEKVTPLSGQGPLIQKEKIIYGTGQHVKADEFYPAYQKQAEDAISKQRISTDAHTIVREYFERIRPK